MTGGADDITATSGELRLEVVAGKATGFEFAVDDRLVIGRDSAGAGRLGDDPELSRHHAEIVRAPNGEFTIKDLSSTNGTFVNGTRVTSAAALCAGDEIEVGGTRLAVRSVPAIPARAAGHVDVRAATVIGDVPVIEQMAAQAERDEPPTLAQPQPQPPSPPQPQPLLLRLTVDFDQQGAQLSVHGDGAPVRIALHHGQWRVEDGAS